ncbi:MAG TPA: hypothetical protein VKE92_08685, partial [Anaerolineales bacterium]|nr:hypothetical protein [Anaerolineales bacterium]
LLLEVDAKTFPKLADHLKNGDIGSVSMGANIDSSVCSVCAHEASAPSEYCDHIKKKGITFEITAENGEKVRKKSYEDCYGINFFEISFVFDPADPTADILEKSASRKYSEEEVRILAEKLGSDSFNEVATYLYSKGQYDGPRGATILDLREEDIQEQFLANMVGKSLSMDRVAALKQSVPLAEQFMAPVGTEPQDEEKNRNFTPQIDQITAPQHVDTLRNDQRCPICHAAELETGADGIRSCPICGHVQEPEPVNNPDLEIARDNILRQDQTQPGNPVNPVDAEADPLDSIQFDQQGLNSQPTSKTENPNGGISDSDMFTVKLRTTSKDEADAILPSKVARIEAKLGHGVHRGVYDAAREAGLQVKVSYPAVKSTEDNFVQVPGNDGIFNLFFAEESALNLGIPMEEVPVVIEATSAEIAENFKKILAETPLPSRNREAKNNKKPILPGSKPSDEPKKETVVSNPQQPVESAVKEALSLDGTVELDGKTYKLVEQVEEDEPKAEVEEPEVEAQEVEDQVEGPEVAEDAEEDAADEEDDREARLLASFKLADMHVEMGLISTESK